MPDTNGSPTESELRALTEAAGRGDAAAIESLMQRYLAELHAFVRLRAGRMILERESSIDLVQSVCREVLTHMERLQHPDEAAFKRWLYVTALRKIKDRYAYYRAEKRDVLREVRPDDERTDRALLDHYRTFSTPSQGLMTREEVQRIEAAFEALTEEQREVLTLAHVVGLSRAEIAVQMGKSEVAVRALLHRALVRISDLVGGDP
jgi:RNA polymerase sigma-70 factor (ECF subfamily)